MRLLHVIRSVDPAHGGTTEAIWKQVAAMKAAGRPVDRAVVTLDAPDAAFLADTPIPVHALGGGAPGWAPRKLRGYGDPRPMARWLRAHAAEFDCALVHGIWNGGSCAARLAMPGGPLPYFVYAHGMLDRWFAEAYPWKHRAKQVSWSLVEGPLLAGARAVLFTAQEEQRRAQGLFRGHRYRGELVDFGTEPLADDPPGTSCGADGPLLYLGRIHRKKGLDMLIEAMGRLPREQCPHLVVIGPDQEGSVAAFQARAAALGLADRIEWRGPVYGAGKTVAMRDAAAFVLPSHQENFGIAVAEALSIGTPVLISDKVAIWREIADAGAGLVAPDTVDGTLDLLRRWQAVDGGRRDAMRRAARTVFAERFDVRQTAPRLVAWMEAELAQDKAARAGGAHALGGR